MKIRGSQTQEIDYVVEHKNWPYPADGAIIIEEEETKDSTVLAYTDGSKSELGVGSGTVMFIGTKIATQIKSRLDSKCSNNQAEQIAIISALEAVATLNIPENSPRTAMIYTDSRITIDSLQNHKNHAYLIEEIRKRVATLKESNWKIKVHFGQSTCGDSW
jgi:ribonuclease HI